MLLILPRTNRRCRERRPSTPVAAGAETGDGLPARAPIADDVGVTDLGRIWIVFVGLVAIAVGVWRARRPQTEEKLRRGFFLPSPPRPSFRQARHASR